MQSSTLERARAIRLVGFDIDGVLTDGRLWYAADGSESKAFHVHDGLGLKLLAAAGIQVCVISARHSAAAARRLAELDVAHVLLGVRDKLPAFEGLLAQHGLDFSAAAFMGDDLPDLAILQRVRLAATVTEASRSVQQVCHWCANRPAGGGAVREFIDWLLEAQGCLAEAQARYLGTAPA